MLGNVKIYIATPLLRNAFTKWLEESHSSQSRTDYCIHTSVEERAAPSVPYIQGEMAQVRCWMGLRTRIRIVLGDVSTLGVRSDRLGGSPI
jgi:hypothetical protein